MVFPGRPTKFLIEKTLYISIPFTWNLPSVRSEILQRDMFWQAAVIGGPAVRLMPDFFSDLEFVKIGEHFEGILQRINPNATKTTSGCIRNCGFCAVPRNEGALIELDDWPDLPILIDNNLLAASQPHFDRVIDRLKKWQWADFNQGIDSRLLTEYHAKRISEIKKPMVRLALDNLRYVDKWQCAFDLLRSAGIAKQNIRSYALIGFDSDPDEAWRRCEFIESHGIKALPQWFHALDALEHNTVTDHQKSIGWKDYERRKIMQCFYKHRKAVE